MLIFVLLFIFGPMKVRHATYVEQDMLHKLKYIAWFERINIQDSYATAIDNYIKQFEKAHGKITPEQLKEARIAE